MPKERGRGHVWDLIGEVTPDTVSAFRSLRELAAEVVRESVGMSDEAFAASSDEAAYRNELNAWHETERELATAGLSPERREQILTWHPPEPPAPHKSPKLSPEELEAHLRRVLKDRFLSSIDSVFLDLIGIDRSWNRSALKNDSPLASALKEKARALAITAAEEWFAKNSAKLVAQMELEKLMSEILYDARSVIRELVKKRISELALARVKEIEDDVILSAIDTTLFESFPILKRMEAIERIKKKATEAAG